MTTASTSLSAQASDPNSQSLDIHMVDLISSPSGAAAPTFSPNGTSAAVTTTATFSAPGSYTSQVIITDSSGNSQDSTVISVTVVSTSTSLGILRRA